MTRKHTKRALLTSALALILCLSMLVGTTFAWFTDSVASGQNQIVAGNLDVDMYHTNKVDTDEKVSASTKLFDDVKRWEPGAVMYENITVKNEGNLALTYQLTLNFANATENANGGTLADVLKVAVVEGGFTGDRADAQELEYDFNLSTFVLSGNLEKGEASKVYGIVVYWEPTDNDNAYNMNNEANTVLSIDLGLNLNATQLTYESDSFNNQYDKDATVYVPQAPAETETATETASESADTVLSTTTATVTVPAGAVEADTELTLTVVKAETTPNIEIAADETTIPLEISLTAGDTAVTTDTTAPILVELNIGKNLEVTNLYHNETAISFDYNASTGIISFETTSFSPYTIVLKCAGGTGEVNSPYVVTNAAQLKSALETGGSVVLGADIVLNTWTENNAIKITKDTVIDLNGFDLDASASARRPFELYEGADLTINANGNETVKVGNYGLVYIPDGASNVTLNGGKYEGNMDNGAFIKPKGDEAINITLNNVSYTDASELNYLIDGSMYEGSALNITVNGGTYNVVNGIITHSGATNVNNAVINAKRVGFEAGTGSNMNITGGTITVAGGTSTTAAPSACVAASDASRTGKGGKVTVTNCTLSSDYHVFALYSDDASSITATGCTITHTGTVDAYKAYEGNGTISVDGAAVALNATQLKSALAAGGTVILGADITLDEVLLIDKDTVINGNGYTLNSSASRAIRITASNIDVTMNDVNIETTAVGAYNADARGISIDTGLSNVSLALNNCTIDFYPDTNAADWAYGVNICGNTTGVKLAINGGTYEGANAINIWGTNNTVEINDATLNCTYGYNAQYHGACVRLNPACTATIKVTDTTFNGTHAEAFCACGCEEEIYTYNADNNTDNTTKQ